MLRNRINYLAILICTGLFFICFNGYYSMYVFYLSLALPVLSFLISLPGMLTLRLTLCIPGEEQPARPAKGWPVPLHMAVATRSVMPSGRARVVLDIKNHFTGEEQLELLEFSPSRMPQVVEHKLACGTCGRITCRLTKARAYDLLGLFWLPVNLRQESSCQVVVLPSVYRPALGLEPTHSRNGEGERYSIQKPGDDPTELFGLRDYRPGDRISRVDWKLSQKTGDLLVREPSLLLTDRVLFLVELSGAGLEADSLMDIFATLGEFLSESEVSYCAAFSREGGTVLLEVDEPEESAAAVEAILYAADRKPLSLPDVPAAGVSRVVYLCSEPDPAMVGRLEDLYPSARLVMVSMRPWGEPGRFPEGLLPVRARIGHVPEDLEGLLL